MMCCRPGKPGKQQLQALPIIALNMNDWPARTDPEEAAIGRSTPTARRLVEASVSPNTRRAYAGALRRLDAWLGGREFDDASMAAYLAGAARRRPRGLERLDGGRRGVLPREARRAARSHRRADRPGARRVPADRRSSGTLSACWPTSTLAAALTATVSAISNKHATNRSKIGLLHPLPGVHRS